MTRGPREPEHDAEPPTQGAAESPTAVTAEAPTAGAADVRSQGGGLAGPRGVGTALRTPRSGFLAQAAALLRTADRGPVLRVLLGLGGLVLGVLGGLLVIRPLTALLVLGVLLGGGALVVGAGLVVRTARTRPLVTVPGLALAGVGVLALVHLPETVRSVPLLVIGAAVVGAVVSMVRAARSGHARGCILGTARAVTLLALAGLTWAWPDLASIVLAAAMALALLGTGVLLLIGTLRRPARERPGPARARRPSWVRVGAAAVIAALLATGSATSVSLVMRTERVDAFYAWQGQIPAAPGTVLRTAPYTGTVPAGATALRVLYATTHADGTPALASAVLAYPDAPVAGPRPVLAWQHGTTGIAQACGPSVGPDALTDAAIPGITQALGRGWAVVATDYPGQGTSGRYPYLIGEGEGRAALDAVRAARNVEPADAGGDVWLWGHSQGGHATLWAGEIAARYAPELPVRGVAALSAVADPLVMAQHVTGADAGPVADVVTAFVAVPNSQEYPDMPLPEMVHPAGLALVDAAARRCVTSPTTVASALAAVAVSQDAPLYRIDLEAGPARQRLAQNRADVEVGVPLFLGQGTADEVVPIAMQRDLAAPLCARGRAVSAHEYPGRSHMGVIAADAPLIGDLFTWVDAVESGEAPSSCPA